MHYGTVARARSSPGHRVGVRCRSSTVNIVLMFDNARIRLQVQDDGRGFDLDKVRHGLGLTSMSDRAQYIGGRFTLQSQLGKGTRVEVTVPLPKTGPAEPSG